MKTIVFEDYLFDLPRGGRMEVRGALAPGESLHLSGDSGIGKTTFLRSIAGLRPSAESGSLKIFDAECAGTSPSARRLSMVFQGFQLFRHLSVFENLAIAFEASPVTAALSTDLKKQRALKMLRSMGLDTLIDSPASELSGGQHQRVAIARALLTQAPLILFDEPYSGLDKSAMAQTNLLLKEYQEEFGATFIVVSHRREDFVDLGGKFLEWKAGMTCLNF